MYLDMCEEGSVATCVPGHVWLLTQHPHVSGLIIDWCSGQNKQEACAIVNK